MKLRIKGNSLRLRVSRSEVAQLQTGACLEETIHFTPTAGAEFTYGLQGDPTVAAPTVHHTQNRVLVLLPADQARTWAETEQVAIAEEISLGEIGSLALLIEKDFACLDRNEEDNQDTFANPNAGRTC